MQNNNHINIQYVGLIASSMFAGVMLCIGVGLGGYWLTVDAAVYAQMFQNIFPYLVPCIALTLLPGLFGVFKSYRSESDSAQKVLWRNSLIGIVLSVLITSFVALPLNFMIWSDNTPASEIETLLVIWLIMHAARLAAAFTGVIYAMKALSSRATH